jgi:hypothetical protein
MRKKTKTVFEEILAGLTEAAAIARGEAEPARIYVPEHVEAIVPASERAINRPRGRRKRAS